MSGSQTGAQIHPDSLPYQVRVPDGGGGGGVDSVTASSPLASSGGTTPNISLTGAIDRSHIAAALAAGGTAVEGTDVTASVRVITPKIGANAGSQHALPGGTAALLAADSPLPAANITGVVAIANGGTGSATGSAAGLNNIPGAEIVGTIPVGVLPTGIPATDIANGSVSDAEFQTLNGINTGQTIQSQIDARVGCQIVIATLPFTGSWTAGDWAGPVSAATGPQGGSGTISAVNNFGTGTLSKFRLQARNGAPSNLNVTVYQSAGGSPSYSPTTAIVPVLSGEQAGSYASAISTVLNDQFIVTTDTDWSGSGMTLVAWFTPTA